MPKVSDVYKRPPVSDRDWAIPFGKFKGKSLAWLMDAEPDYLLWATSHDLFELSSELWTEFYIQNPWAE